MISLTIALAILGIACVIYGTMVLAVGSGTLFFLFWYVLAALFFAAGLFVHFGLFAALPNAAKYTGAIVLAVILIAIIGVNVQIMSEFDSKGEDNLDYIVVLGAQVRPDGPSLVLKFRLDAARDYLNANPNTRCIVSGAKGFNEPVEEAFAMAAYLEEQGIDPERIICEDQAQNTDQNIANSMAFFNPANDRIGIVTNNFHAYRAKRIAERHGIAHVSVISAPSSLFFLPNNLAREDLALIKAHITGTI